MGHLAVCRRAFVLCAQFQCLKTRIRVSPLLCLSASVVDDVHGSCRVRRKYNRPVVCAVNVRCLCKFSKGSHACQFARISARLLSTVTVNLAACANVEATQYLRAATPPRPRIVVRTNVRPRGDLCANVRAVCVGYLSPCGAECRAVCSAWRFIQCLVLVQYFCGGALHSVLTPNETHTNLNALIAVLWNSMCLHVSVKTSLRICAAMLGRTMRNAGLNSRKN